MSLYVSHTGDPELSHTGGTPKYARVPMSVLCDSRLKPLDVRVYAALALSTFQGSTCSIGIRQIAIVACCAKRKAQESVAVLIECGHVKVGERQAGRRSKYVLTSPVFGQKQGKVDVVVSGPRGKRLASVRKTA